MTDRAAPTRPRLAASLALVTLAGLALKLQPGPPGGWLRDHGAGLVSWVATGVLLVTCGLEVQLWHPPGLEALRSTFFGHALIGSTFSAWDFPHYALGGLLGSALAHRLGERCEADRSTA